jgi:hypothetical protein
MNPATFRTSLLTPCFSVLPQPCFDTAPCDTYEVGTFMSSQQVNDGTYSTANCGAFGCNGSAYNAAHNERDKVAALGEQLDAIHFANMLYWKNGATSSREARAEYQFRQDRVEEIRKEFTGTTSDTLSALRCA